MMNIFKKFKDNRGQSVLEYFIIAVIVVTAAAGMSVSIRRGAQAIIKEAADQIGKQEDAEIAGSDKDSGHLIGARTITRSDTKTTQADFPGGTTTSYNDVVVTTNRAETGLGFTPTN